MTDRPAAADGEEVRIAPAAEGPWAALPGVRLGGFGGEPEAHVLVSRDGQPALRLELATPAGEYCFQHEALRWRGWIVVGCDEGVWFVPEGGGEPRRHRLSMYFSAFHAGPDFLLAASGENVTRFGPAGDVVWRSPPVAVDGVNIHDVDVDGDRVEGHGEWDPPGGWRPFVIRLSDGQIVEGAKYR